MNGDELGVDCGGSCTPCPCMTSPCVETGLVGHWPFELSLDDTVGDSDGRRLGGTPTYVAGVAGMAISLDGNGDAVAVEGASALTAFQSDVFTIVGWARHRPKAESEPRFLWSVDEDGDRDLHYLGYKSSPTFQCRNGTSDGRSNIEINVGNPTTAETWHHFAVTSSDPGIWAFYFDGCLVGAAGPDHRLRLSGAQCFVMGGEQRNACVLGSADMAWNGEIDEVSVFDRILSPDEIAFSASLATSEIPVCPGG
ncbi:MAG: LamG domain-containing protein [Actinobacteria bacterium]|nr:LamG domain-containing protein [Actinomycetota bacterium]